MDDLTKRLRTVSDMINMGERISWGQETTIMDEAADYIDHLRMRLVLIASGDYRVCGHTAEDVAKDALLHRTSDRINP